MSALTRVLRPRRILAVGTALTSTALVLAGCMTTAAVPRVDPADPGSARLDEVTVQRFEYPTRGAAADPEQNWADLYLPAGAQQVDSIPLTVLIHGGAWQTHLGADVFDPLARELARRGMAVYNIEYRQAGSGGGWPVTYRDVADALDHVEEVDRRFPQITTEDEVVVGHGTGAQLAVWSGTRHLLEEGEVGADPVFRPTRVVSIAGPLDLAAAADDGSIAAAIGGTPSEVPARYEMVDPVRNIAPDVPVIAIHGTADTVISPESSRRYVEAVRRANGRARLDLIEGENHVSIVSVASPAHGRVVDTISRASAADIDRVTG